MRSPQSFVSSLSLRAVEDAMLGGSLGPVAIDDLFSSDIGTPLHIRSYGVPGVYWGLDHVRRDLWRLATGHVMIYCPGDADFPYL